MGGCEMTKKLSKKKVIAITLIIVVCILCVVIRVIFGNKLFFVRLSPVDSIVSTESIEKDINSILRVYGLKKDKSELFCEEGDSIYDIHYKKDGIKGDALLIHVRPILFGSKDYVEIKTLMEIWLYITERNFEKSIVGVSYYFTAPELKSAFAPLNPNEIHLSRKDFMSIYSELDIDKLSHKNKVEKLTEEYIKKINYKRNTGHIQVN